MWSTGSRDSRWAKNTIKGGGGDDRIAGGARACDGLVAADGDVLQGEAGDDVFYVPVSNCFATLSGGAGDNTSNFSGRSAGVSISNEGMANDGACHSRRDVSRSRAAALRNPSRERPSVMW